MSALLVGRRGGVDVVDLAGELRSSVPVEGQVMLVETDPDASLAWALTDVDGEGLLWTFAIRGDVLSQIADPVSTRGGLPCSLALDAARGRLVVANYGGGGDIAGDLAEFSLGSGHPEFVRSWSDAPRDAPPTPRHTVSHPHHVAFAGESLRLVDMGTDRITWFRGGPFADPVGLDLERGIGPRWAVEDGDRLVVGAEIESVLIEVSGDVPGVVERVTELPGATFTTNHPSELVPLGGDRFAVGARGSDQLYVVELRPDRPVCIVQAIALPGAWPGSLTLVDGMVVVACRHSGGVFGYRASDGVLEETPTLAFTSDEPNGVRALSRR